MSQARNQLNMGIWNFSMDPFNHHFLTSPPYALEQLVQPSNGLPVGIRPMVGWGDVRDLRTEARLQRHAPSRLSVGMVAPSSAYTVDRLWSRSDLRVDGFTGFSQFTRPRSAFN